MYVALIAILIGCGLMLLYRGIRYHHTAFGVSGIVVLAGTYLFFTMLSVWVDALWYHELGYGHRFWTELFSKFGFGVAGLLVSSGVLYLFTIRLSGIRGVVRMLAVAVGAVAGFGWGYASWATVMQYIEQSPVGIADPILGHDVAFYLFSLPLYRSMHGLLVFLCLVGITAHIISLVGRFNLKNGGFEPYLDDSRAARMYPGLFLNSAVLLFLLAAGRYLSRFELLFSEAGVVTGAGWTDVHIRLPLYTVIAVVMTAAGLFLLIAPLRKRLRSLVDRQGLSVDSQAVVIGIVVVLAGAVWVLALGVVPGLFQWLRVEPNEITYEKPYISNNIAFTSQGFNLDTVEERQFQAAETLDTNRIRMNSVFTENIRLWDWRALIAVYNQFQEIRLYYEFDDVDIDRYMIDGMYRQVMVSAREMQVGNIPESSQTFINRRFKYTHGYGITLTKVNEFTPEGLPDLLIKDIPPQSRYKELEVTRPEIYYGELTDTPVIGNSSETEFDYPSGDQNVYGHYEGTGGIPISNIWRKFLFGWTFDGTKLFLSGYPAAESRMMFRRQIQKRVQAVAPFLKYDGDPYIVCSEGRLYWIMDAYTTSSHYPYSETFLPGSMLSQKQGASGAFWGNSIAARAGGINYIRNSVKVVIDAYDGTVDLYVFDPDDPIISVWQRIFPDLFKSREDMPEQLVKHVRYPAGLLLIQGLVYAKYHMTDPDVFYNQEDLWVRATEKYYGNVQPVEPYYILWQPPDSDRQEFVLMLPFTPKNKQVMIGWIAGMCDGDNYGRFLAYKFPKEKRVLGPQQVETKIDQDPTLSGQLTLWDQRGSRVIRGNVLALPVDDMLLYVEPIYLQSDTAAYPELRLVVVMHNDNMSYGSTFEEALRGLLDGQSGPETAAGQQTFTDQGAGMAGHIRNANQAFESYLEYLGNGEFENAANALETLQQTLQRMNELATGNGAE